MGRFGRIGAALALALAATGAQAAVVMNITDDVDGIYADYYGAIDLTGLSVVSRNFALGGYLSVGPRAELVLLGDPGPGQYQNSYAYVGPSSLYKPGGWINPTRLGNGPVIGLSGPSVGPYFYLDENYVSGAPIRGSNTWTDASTGGGRIAGSSLAEGRYVYTLANAETVTLNIGNAFEQPMAPVPVPASVPLLAGGLCGLVWLRRQRG